jgi:hypothetical protein
MVKTANQLKIPTIVYSLNNFFNNIFSYMNENDKLFQRFKNILNILLKIKK